MTPDPHATLVVSPANQSRQDLNDVIHRAMQREGQVDRDEHRTPVLVPRQEITGADRQWAERYDQGDVVRYSRGSKALGIDAGDYARVEHVDAKTNQMTVRTDDERAVSYDPRRLQGVTLYRETKRAFAAGDRVQMTAPDRERAVPNRELGTIERIDANGRMEIRWDSGRTFSFEAGERRHLGYGYAVTSHSSQGQTARRLWCSASCDTLVCRRRSPRPGDSTRHSRINPKTLLNSMPPGEPVTSREQGCRRGASFLFPHGCFPLVFLPDLAIIGFRRRPNPRLAALSALS